jgi:hypothetical protein
VKLLKKQINQSKALCIFCVFLLKIAQMEKLTNILIHAHSGLRWVVLILLVVAITNALLGGKRGLYEKRDKMINLFAMIFLHVQLLIGLILYLPSGKTNFSSGWMKIEMFRFYGMEHFLGMLIAIILVTIGRKKAEKAEIASDKHKKIVVWYAIGLVLILASIPWPFREALGGSWF